MNSRISTLWIPGLISLTFAMGLLMALRTFGPKPHVVWMGRMPMLLYIPWLAVLPLCGAAGAHLSRRSGGEFPACIAAGLFPGVVLFGLVCSGLFNMAITNQLDRPQWLYIAVGLLNWAVLPGAALLLGAAPLSKSARVAS